MELRSLEDFLLNNILSTEQVNDLVYVYNANRVLLRTYKAEDLTRAFYSMSNDDFFDVYGFNYVPR